MDTIVIRGGNPLNGRIPISGAKNAALPLLAACLLTDDRLTLTNLPQLADISTMARLLDAMGVETDSKTRVHKDGHTSQVMSLSAGRLANMTAPYDQVRKMRASILVLGPLIARFGRAKVSLPGGCAIGARPVDIHLKGLEQLGAEIILEDGYVFARARKGLKGAHINLPFASVGATENLLMAAVLADGDTVIENAAREPEIGDLANCLVTMGAKIGGIGSARLEITGTESLHGGEYAVISDRIEAGTYAIAAAITGGTLELIGARRDLIGALADMLEKAGVELTETDTGLTVSRKNGLIQGTDIHTQPFPGFPTDLQAQTMALLATAEGASSIQESIFENRFMHVPELSRMGADITLQGSTAIIRGVDRLKGAPVMATDLRASVSLVLAALAAEGETIVNRVYHLDRGYERVEEKLGACGADIRRVS